MPTKRNSDDEIPKSLTNVSKRDPAQVVLELVDARIEVLDQKLSNQMQEVIKALEVLSLNVGQLAGMVKQQTQNIEKLTQTLDTRLERLERAIEADREVAKMQSGNVQQMVALAAQQQQTLNTLVAKLAA